jgi:asparagine synthase (glutamine-hydrolysing)
MLSTLSGVLTPRRTEASDALHGRVRSLYGAETEHAADGPLTAGWHRQNGRTRVALDGALVALEGRLDNAAGLAAELGSTLSSTEALLLEGFRRWDHGLLERLRGDFVVLIWLPEQGRGVLARDQVGVRGLFFHQRDGALCFATEVKHLLRLLPRRPGPDDDSMHNWLANGAPAPGGTMYAGVHPVPPGHAVALSSQGSRVFRYWHPRYEPPIQAARDELIAGTRDHVRRAVELRCGEGEDVAVLLSGGLDSTTIAAIAGRLPASRRPIAGYSGVFPEHAGVDETSIIDELTGQLGLRSVRNVVRSGSQLTSALEHTARWELPVLGPNGYWDHALLATAARDGATALLDGEGGDEAFGPRRYLVSDLLRRGRIGAASEMVRRLPGAGDDPAPDQVRLVLRNFGLMGALPPRVQRSRRRLRGYGHWAPSWFTAAGARRLFELYDPWEWKAGSGPRWWAFQSWMFTKGIHDIGILDHVRRRSEAAGLEGRHPFLDLDLIEFGFRLPPEATFDPFFDRLLVREAFADALPATIVRRPEKSGFDSLVRTALTSDHQAIRLLLGDPGALVNNWVRRDVVASQLLDFAPESHPKGTWVWADELWRLITAEVWLRSLEDPGFTATALARLPLGPSRQEIEVREP